jgi:hypothetical protein
MLNVINITPQEMQAYDIWTYPGDYKEWYSAIWLKNKNTLYIAPRDYHHEDIYDYLELKLAGEFGWHLNPEGLIYYPDRVQPYIDNVEVRQANPYWADLKFSRTQKTAIHVHTLPADWSSPDDHYRGFTNSEWTSAYYLPSLDTVYIAPGPMQHHSTLIRYLLERGIDVYQEFDSLALYYFENEDNGYDTSRLAIRPDIPIKGNLRWQLEAINPYFHKTARIWTGDIKWLMDDETREVIFDETDNYATHAYMAQQKEMPLGTYWGGVIGDYSEPNQVIIAYYPYRYVNEGMEKDLGQVRAYIKKAWKGPRPGKVQAKTGWHEPTELYER